MSGPIRRHARYRFRTAGLSSSEATLRPEAGRAAIAAAVAEAVGPELKSTPRIVHAPGHSFSDVAAKCVHVINLASLRELEAELGTRIDPLRFRAILVIDEQPGASLS